MPRKKGTELSKLIKWSEALGAIYIYILLSSGSFDSFSFGSKAVAVSIYYLIPLYIATVIRE
jgi:hypothetical protein